MACYFRHLQEIFKKAGIEITSQNKHEVDKVIHELVGVDYKNCQPLGRKSKSELLTTKRNSFPS